MIQKALPLLNKLVVYVVGLFVLAFGISLSIRANLGVTPMSSIPRALELLAAGKLSLGVVTMIVYALMLAGQAIVLGKRFKLISLLQLPATFVFGLFVDLTNLMLSPIPPIDAYVLRLVFLALSITFVATGIFLYTSAKLMPLPGEGLVFAFVERFSLKFHTYKVVFDCSLTTIALIIGIVFMQSMGSVREGTVISALLIGLTVKLISTPFKTPLERFLGFDNATIANETEAISEAELLSQPGETFPETEA